MPKGQSDFSVKSCGNKHAYCAECRPDTINRISNAKRETLRDTFITNSGIFSVIHLTEYDLV